jgi:single-strand DNA-binding protein
MADLKMPELNSVMIAGNLTKDPVIRQTRNGTPVANFSIASNRKFRDGDNQWQEDVCYVGIVAWNRLAESCVDKLRKGSAVLVEGELQSRTWHTEEGATRSTVEIKARRIQFLNKRRTSDQYDGSDVVEDDISVFDCDDDYPVRSSDNLHRITNDVSPDSHFDSEHRKHYTNNDTE